jgi:prepilin signal peptidase PulO-like enzyme (type II secretory pathway)
MLDPAKAATAFGFVLGVSAGAAVANYWRGRSFLAGRRCARCGASLSLWPAAPLLSWLATRQRCPQCGEAGPLLHAGIEAGVVLIGVSTILLAPLRIAVVAAAVGWGLLFGLLVWRRR